MYTSSHASFADAEFIFLLCVCMSKNDIMCDMKRNTFHLVINIDILTPILENSAWEDVIEIHDIRTLKEKNIFF